MKLSQLISIDHLKKHSEATEKFTDSSGVLLGRHLTQIDPKVFTKQYPANVFLNSGLAIDNSGGYADTIKKIRVSGEGDFIPATSRDKSKGRITVSGEVDEMGAYEFGAFIDYTKQEIEKAKLGRYNLVERLFGISNLKYHQKIDEILATGFEKNEGLLNYSGFTKDTSGTPVAGNTGVQNYNFISKLINDQANEVNNVESYKADKVIMPIDVMNVITSQVYSSTNASGETVLQMLKRNFPSISFLTSFRCKNVGGTSVIVAYSTNSEAMVNRIPVPLVIGDTVREGSFGYKADMHYRIGGLDVADNSAGRILTGL